MKKAFLFVCLLACLNNLKAQQAKQGDSPSGKEAMKDKKELTMDLHPNPNNGNFTISFMKQPENATLSIYDLLGNYILKNTLISQLTNEVNLNNQPKGIYFIEIISGKEKSISKVVIQ